MIILQVMNERMNERLPKFFLRRRSVLALIFFIAFCLCQMPSD